VPAASWTFGSTVRPTLQLLNVLSQVLLAFAECRNFTGDHCWPAGAPYAEQPGGTEICYRRSTTAGAAWELPLTLPVAQLHGSADAFNYRVVYSRRSDRVIVHYSASPEPITANHTQPFGNPNFQITSGDDGATWSRPESLESLGLGSVCGRYLGTDGSGVEDMTGRLLMSAYYEASPVGRAACLYASETGGDSWHVLSYPHSSLQAGTEQGPWEFSVAPLGDGQTIYLNGRHLRQPAWSLGCHPDIHPHNLPEPRIAGFSSDGGRTFSLSPTDQPTADTDCDGSHFAALSVGNRTVLLAGPAGPAPFPLLPPNDRNNSGRRRMTVFQSSTGVQTWSSQLLDPGYAGYAALSLLPGQSATNATEVGLLFERGSINPRLPCDGSCSVGYLTLRLGAPAKADDISAMEWESAVEVLRATKPGDPYTVVKSLRLKPGVVYLAKQPICESCLWVSVSSNIIVTAFGC
jgi:hypothetical protein